MLFFLSHRHGWLNKNTNIVIMNCTFYFLLGTLLASKDSHKKRVFTFLVKNMLYSYFLGFTAALLYYK